MSSLHKPSKDGKSSRASAKSRAELETIIRRAADEQDWEVFSEDPRVIRKLTQFYGPGRPKGGGAVWTVPKTKLSFRNPAYTVSPERKSQMAAEAKARFAAARTKTAPGGD